MNVGVSHACCASNRGDFRARNRLLYLNVTSTYVHVHARTPTNRYHAIPVYAGEYRSAADGPVSSDRRGRLRRVS